MERVILSIAQVSIHAAFRISFMLTAAMEDYQPELANGTPNPGKLKYIVLSYGCCRIFS
jgi:hypothetical protein|tara:strand:- start:28 stop:204 length:177 start_codon:yes stop_codon:yes gene_type:complete